MAKILLAAFLFGVAMDSAIAADPAAERKEGKPVKTQKKIDAATGKDKVITTPSGLKYIDIKQGTGETPKTGEQVKVHYTGTLKDGTKFDSSVDRGEPFAFILGVGQVIRGWDEGVGTMKVGGKRKLIIPPQLGYGAQGAGNVIPPNAELHFVVELLEIRK